MKVKSKTLTTPTNTKPGSVVDSKVMPICWIKDHEREISTNPTGRYAESYNKAGISNALNVGTRKYKIYIPLKSGTEITVEVRAKIISKISPDKSLTKAENKTAIEKAIAEAKIKIENGINGNWNSKFKLEIIDPACGKKIFPIKYIVKWVTKNEHTIIRVHAAYPREGVTGLTMDVSSTTTDWVYAHEFGHTLGLPDEYSYSLDTETVKYYKPDGTLDTAITAPPDGKSSSDPSATIMAAYGSLITLPRHAWNIAIETRDLLTEKIGRKISCDIF